VNLRDSKCIESSKIQCESHTPNLRRFMNLRESCIESKKIQCES